MQRPNLPDFDSLWDYSAPDKSEAKFREILPVFSGNERLELLTQIARAEGLQGKFDDAHRTLDEVEKQLGEGSSRAHVRHLLERGRVFNSSQQKEKAGHYFEKALDEAKQLNEDFYAVDAIHMLAIVADSASALTLNLRAIQLAESSKQARAHNWLGSLYNNMGWTYHDMGEFESALEMFEKAEAFRKSKGDAGQIRIATWAVARVLRSLGRVEESLSQQLILEKEFESAGETDGYVFEEIGECLLLLNRADEARPYFTKAYEVLSQDQFLVESEAERLDRLKKLAD
jgi:tetratricopeptide (TPR) repeat protein